MRQFAGHPGYTTAPLVPGVMQRGGQLIKDTVWLVGRHRSHQRHPGP